VPDKSARAIFNDKRRFPGRLSQRTHEPTQAHLPAKIVHDQLSASGRARSFGRGQAALTWAGLMEWQTIKVPVAAQVDLRRHSRELLAGRSGPIVAGPEARSHSEARADGHARAACGGVGLIAVANLGASRAGWLARVRKRAGLIGNGPTNLARDTKVSLFCRCEGGRSEAVSAWQRLICRRSGPVSSSP